MRPRLLVGVAGTATEVGKTWSTAAVAAELRAGGARVGARKPVQSHDPADPAPLDADVLASATGEAATVVCPQGRTLAVPMAPPMAADALGLPRPSLADLVEETVWPPGLDIGFVETVGGVASPVADDGHSADLLERLGVDVTVLVADAGLGTIDAVRTALAFLPATPTIVFLNRFDVHVDVHRRNVDWLRTVDRLDPCTTTGAVAAALAALSRPPT